MPFDLQQEIRKKKPFELREQEASPISEVGVVVLELMAVVAER